MPAPLVHERWTDFSSIGAPGSRREGRQHENLLPFCGCGVAATGRDCTYCELGVFESQRSGALDYPKEKIAHMPGWKQLKTDLLSS